MDKRREMHQQTATYKPSGVNFFGARARISDTAPTTVGGKSNPQTHRPRSAADASVGKPYYPNNGHHRNLNFLGRSSIEKNDRLLTNR